VLTSTTGGREPVTPRNRHTRPWTLAPSQERKRVCETRRLKAGRLHVCIPRRKRSCLLCWNHLGFAWNTRGPGKHQRQKGQVCDAERNLRSYFRVAIIRAVSKAPTDAARWCAGRSNKYWLIPVVLPKSKEHRSERTSCQSSLSNVCPPLFCVFVCV
jgi:hypothetical protein